MSGRSLVFDSWAVIAWLCDEPAASRVQELLERAERGEISIFMSLINAGEVFYITAKKHSLAKAQKVIQTLLGSPINFLLPTEEEIWRAAEIKARYPLSYADAFAVALSLLREAALVTGDPEIKHLEGKESLSLVWLR
ncbi:type II toxin-antitoxin system VapC family toxin [Thermosulfuriphilus ammonigenes]|uniref:Type II toxin-antitoxin system VapC family toxin n=1 Tax=Thermosulfuriphilus ammonigenes TaxID=1936021 RepID=A0A6G7PU61_9BACT|nr:type II toxin-antitoxin system VapC family toxin [Thermosulfuriphilus ammonigenes]MBA2848670.1 ribonuclease VapC [Thermosulfuriphilus ammonigenes]QIJ71192.1 type II toxin-antitoxin system VapC family toxin [Thermosulfuriphilus ammonigenes]